MLSSAAMRAIAILVCLDQKAVDNGHSLSGIIAKAAADQSGISVKPSEDDVEKMMAQLFPPDAAKAVDNTPETDPVRIVDGPGANPAPATGT